MTVGLINREADEKEGDDGMRVRERHGNLLKLPMRTIDCV